MGVITDKQLQSRAGATDTWLIEDGPRGAGRFVARITPAGERLFYYRYTDSKGVRVRLPIGSFDPKGASGMTLKAARARADQFAKIYLSGQRDLREFLETSQRDAQAAQAKARRDEEQAEAAAELAQQRRLTVRTLFDRWQSVELQPHLRADGKRAGRKDGGLYVKDQFTRHLFPKIGDIAAADLRKADVLAVLDVLKAQGKLRTCNVLLASLKQMLRFALARDIIEKNVLDTVTKRDAGGAEVERERVLTADELKDLAEQVSKAKLEARSAHAIWLIVATGCRVGELMGAQWKDVRTKEKSWYLPETKNERPHTIHLSQFAVGHFDAIANLKRPEGPVLPWVFPNARGTGPVCVKSFGKQLADRQKPDTEPFKGRSKKTTSLQLKGGRWTAHDLRRTAATLMAQLGFSTDVIDECLNHIIQSRVSRIYIRDRREADQAKAFDALGVRLTQLLADSGKTAEAP